MHLFACLIALAPIAHAQDPAPSEPPPSAEDEELRQRVRTLERALDELRGNTETTQTEIPLDLEMRLRAYTAVNINYLDEEQILAFNVDEIMFQYTANLDRKMTINMETAFEVEEHGMDVGLEALEIVLAPRPQLQVVAGAFHLPLSPWASTASQGAFRYLPTAVPGALKEELGREFLPIDQLGFQLRGRVPVGLWQFSYGASVTNGRAPDPGTAAQVFDVNNFKALMGEASLRAPSGFSVGLGGYYDLLDVHDESLLDGTEAPGPEEYAKETVVDDGVESFVTVNADWHGGPVELSSEFYLMLHNIEGERYTNFTGFFLVGVPIDRTTPFFMLDTVHVAPDDLIYAYYDPAGTEVEFVPGVRYDLGLRVSLKAEMEAAYHIDESEWELGAQAQIAAGF